MGTLWPALTRWVVLTLSSLVLLRTCVSQTTDWNQVNDTACGEDEMTLRCSSSEVVVVVDMVCGSSPSCQGGCIGRPRCYEDDIEECSWKSSTCGPFKGREFGCRPSSCGWTDECHWVAAKKQCIDKSTVYDIREHDNATIGGGRGFVKSPNHPGQYPVHDSKVVFVLASNESLNIESNSVDMKTHCPRSESDDSDYLRIIQVQDQAFAHASSLDSVPQCTDCDSGKVAARADGSDDVICLLQRGCDCGKDGFNLTVNGPAVVVAASKGSNAMNHGFAFKFEVTPQAPTSDVPPVTNDQLSTTVTPKVPTSDVPPVTNAQLSTTFNSNMPENDEPSFPNAEQSTTGQENSTKTSQDTTLDDITDVTPKYSQSTDDDPNGNDDDQFWLFMFIGAMVALGFVLVCFVAACMYFRRNSRRRGSCELPQSGQSMELGIIRNVESAESQGTTSKPNGVSNGTTEKIGNGQTCYNNSMFENDKFSSTSWTA